VKASTRANLALTVGLSCAAALGLVLVPSVFASRLAVFAYFVASTAVLLIFLVERTTRVREVASADSATGLPNRSAYERWISTEIRHAVRCRTDLALLVIDVDRLKEVNDREGHAAGDCALRRVADSLVRTCRSRDWAARWGGDEFVIIAPATTAREALVLAERIRATLRRLSVAVTVSIGAADLESTASRKPQELFEAADRALYRAKASGRDCAVAAAAPTSETSEENHAGASHPCAG
jgi:diguanylate cyclase (GGDEF)-like protein